MKKDAGQAGMTKKKHSIRCPHYYENLNNNKSKKIIGELSTDVI
jgi:hypothetical protein